MKSRTVTFLSVFFLFFTLSASVFGQKTDYVLSMPEPHTHYFEVDMNVSGVKAESFDIKMPVWAPGSYLIREFAKSVEGLTAESGGKPIEVKKVNKNTWRIYSNKADKVKISYKVYAFELSVRTSYVDDSHGYLNGTSVFMYIKDKLDISGTLKINPYTGWTEVSTGLPMVNGDKWTRSYENYDVLVDCPIEIGNHMIFEFDAAGVKHTVAMYGEGNYDVERLKTDMARIVETCTDVFGFNPNEDYTFIIHNLTVGSGGLEHANSTTLQVDRWTYSDKKYKGFLSLVAHEYFHLWNVKRIRPIELGPFDYDRENYTSLLWIMEGFTSYYDELLLVRAGFYTKDEYLNKLVSTISRVENQPGNKVLPLSEASMDAWIKLYRPNENSYNTTISYYSKGSLVAAMLDMEIIHSSGGSKSLDDVLVYLYKEYYEKKGRGFTEEEAKKAIEKVAGKNMDEFFSKYINGTETIDYAKYFGYMGFDLVNLNSGNQRPSIGVRTSSAGGQIVVQSVTRNTTAYHGGLSANDELIAFNGIRVTGDNLDDLLNLTHVGDTIELLIARDGQIQNLKMDVKPDPSVLYTLTDANIDMLLINKWL